MYDPLNRLTGSTLKNAETEAVLSSKSYRYDAVGNLVNKSDVSATDYGYGAGSAGPHAVTSAGGHTYAYDASGNMVSGGGRTLTWTSFQKPRTMAKGTTRSTFEYGPERKRVRQVKVKGSVTETVTYVGGLYERVEKTGVATEHVHYIFAGGARIAVETASEAANSSAELRYLHQDHLGSVDVVTNESGAVVERLSFGAFGERRVAQGTTAWQDSALALSSAETRRGFTDHEQLDDFGLVHMNGRVYDPHLGRFLSADPFVQFALSSQGYNRYTYVNNNPLSFTDPSGYFKPLLRKVKKVFKKVLSNKVVRIAAAAAFAYSGGGFGAEFLLGSGTDIAATLQFGITKGAVGGFGAGLIASGGDFKAALVGGLTGAGFGWAGRTGLSAAQRVFAHSAIGGVSSELSGGKFSSGFISSAFAKVATPSVANAIGDNVIAKTIAMATVAGTASELAGGKFGNGAMSGAFAYLYNELSKEEIEKRIFSNSSVVDGVHNYQIFGMVCAGGLGCDEQLAMQASEFSDSRDVPFWFGDKGTGIKHPLFQPIDHQEHPGQMMSINKTLPGHFLHPEQVVFQTRWLTGHVVYNQAPLYYSVVGRGAGSFPRANNVLGLGLFRSNAEDVLREFGR